MTDIATRGCDWHLTETLPRLLEEDKSLATAVEISLFTDARAAPDEEIPDGSDDPRGWWGAVFDEDGAPPLGSKLWLLNREKQTDITLARARRYAREALTWLVSDRIAASVDVATSWTAMGRMAIDVTITRKTGSDAAFGFVWDNLNSEIERRAI
ncbi:MAG: phage GP46 family protein [Pseudomonadota bacterium]